MSRSVALTVRTWSSLGPAILFCAACGGGGAVPDGGVDAAPTPRPDAQVIGNGAIEGTWVLERPDCSEQFIFRGDGTYGNDRSGCSAREVRISGTYTLGEDSITLTGTDAIGGEHARISRTYYLAEDHLALSALLPQGMTDGILGTWEGSHTWEILDDADGVTGRSGGTTTIVFAAGGDYVQTYVYFGSTDSAVMAGTWTEQADGTFETLFVAGDTAAGGTLVLADGAALVGGLFERQ